ncbi:hypothetical protein BLNAU_13261 [Blattamonas nauphoetae]|nr:hypothetical protein BLNAU_13261 [Blattamonas nauphoetae]
MEPNKTPRFHAEIVPALTHLETISVGNMSHIELSNKNEFIRLRSDLTPSFHFGSSHTNQAVLAASVQRGTYQLSKEEDKPIISSAL